MPLSNAELADKLSTVADGWQTFIEEFRLLVTTLPDGGVNGDGTVLVTDGIVSELLPSYKKLVGLMQKGDPGADGGIRFAYSSTTTDADPTTGKLRFNNASLAATTSIFVSIHEFLGGDVTAWLESFDDSTSTLKTRLIIRQGSTAFAIFNVTGAVTTASNYRKLVVSYVASFGAFTNGAQISLSDSTSGNTGTTGAPGADGAPGSAGPAAWRAPAPWATTTAYLATDPKHVVTIGGRTYVCDTSHTSGTFATDLAAGKWTLIAEKGADGANGAGTGDVTTTGAVTAGHIAVFNDTSGDVLVDGGGAIGVATAGDILNRAGGDGRYRKLTDTVAATDLTGTIPNANLPALAITDTFPVSSQAAMLALTAEKGDVAIRSDLNKTFILSTNSPTTLADWKEMLSPTDSVTSVAGKVGVVTLVKGDVGLGNVDNTADTAKPVSTAATAAFAPKASPTFTGTVEIGEAFKRTGVVSPASLSADQNDFNPTGLSTASRLRLAVTGAIRNFTGLAGGADGREITITNIGALDMVFVAESASSTAANRFSLETGFLALKPNAQVTFTYDTNSLRWRAPSVLQPLEAFPFALGDEKTTAVTTGTAVLTFRMPYAFRLSNTPLGVRSSLGTISSSGLVTIDIKVNGTSIFSTLLSIDASEKTSVTAATPAVLTTFLIPDDAEVTIDVTAAGSTAKGLKGCFIGQRA